MRPSYLDMPRTAPLVETAEPPVLNLDEMDTVHRDALIAERNAAVKMAADAKQDHERAMAAHVGKESELAAVLEEMTRLRSDFGTAQEQVAAAREQITGLENNVAALTAELDQTKSDLAKTRSELAETHDMLAQATKPADPPPAEPEPPKEIEDGAIQEGNGTSV